MIAALLSGANKSCWCITTTRYKHHSSTSDIIPQPSDIEKVKPIKTTKMFEKVKQAIHVGHHVTDLMRLPCVYSCHKEPDGFRAFFENENVWIHHFNQVLNVPKGSPYRASDGEWYEADEDMMIVVRCGGGEQMMTQAEFERFKQKKG